MNKHLNLLYLGARDRYGAQGKDSLRRGDEVGTGC